MTRKPDKGDIRRDVLAHQVMGGPSTDSHVHTDDELHGGQPRSFDPQPWREADGGEGIYPNDPLEGTPG